jgi:hypothetical protein
MARPEQVKHVVSGMDLLREAEEQSPGVADILRIYLRAMWAVEQDVSVETDLYSEAVYYTSDSTAVC